MATYTQIVEDLAAFVHDRWMSSQHAKGVESVASRHDTGELMIPFKDLHPLDQADDRRTVAAVLLGLKERPVAQLLGLLHGLRTDEQLLAELRRAANLLDSVPPELADQCAETVAREDGQQ